MRFLLYFFCSCILFPLAGFSQSSSHQKDIGDVFQPISDTSVDVSPQVGKLYLPLLPIVGYAPANGFLIGIGIAPGILLDSASHTRMSSGVANIQFTTKNQINFNFRHNVYTSHDRFIIKGDWRLLIFSQATYGLGIYKTPPIYSFNGFDATTDVGQDMRFNYFKFHESAFKKITKEIYLGAGIKIDHHFSINDQQLQLAGPDSFITSHYAYSKQYQFSTNNYSMNGVSAEVLWDTRDNPINAYKGYLIGISFRHNTTWLGSSQNSNQLAYEFRKYLRLTSKDVILAFWTYGQFQFTGDIPYLSLPALGWDTYNRSGRGYIQGRYRGVDLLYIESELRFKITPSGLFGGVVFVNTTTASNPFTEQRIAEAFAVGYGAGVRLKMSKESRTNICADIGVGQRSYGIYFGIQEAF
ncbi:MAG: outer membrane protein assembly factor [Cytophagaceae bacterium]|jgi:hypothetical protein|nr:outer membrane protein assembly factor [Cytophagaceae bacterium]